jgi:hypothetical protein
MKPKYRLPCCVCMTAPRKIIFEKFENFRKNISKFKKVFDFSNN